jgi:hypothetical protein
MSCATKYGDWLSMPFGSDVTSCGCVQLLLGGGGADEVGELDGPGELALPDGVGCALPGAEDVGEPEALGEFE